MNKYYSQKKKYEFYADVKERIYFYFDVKAMIKENYLILLE